MVPVLNFHYASCNGILQPPGSSQRPGGKHERGESTRGSGKRKANKANDAQRRGPGQPGPETGESRRQRGRTEEEKKNQGTEQERRKRGDTKGEGRGGGGSNHEGAARGQAGDTNEASAHGEPGSVRRRQTNKTQRQGPGHPGPETRESRRQRGRTRGEKKKPRHRAKTTKTARHRRAGGGGDQRPTRGIQKSESAGRTEGRKKKTNTDHGEPSTTNTNQRQGPGHPGPENTESKKQGGADKRKKKTSARQQGTATTGRERGGGQPPESGQRPGNTKKARAHGEPRSARPTKQTTQSAKGQGTRGRKPKKARDKGGARKKTTEKREKKTRAKEETAGKQTTKTGANPAQRGPSKAERQSSQRKRGGALERAREAGPPDPARTDEHTHTRTGPGRGVLRPARGGVGVHTKQPRCTGRVPRRTTDGTGNRTRQ